MIGITLFARRRLTRSSASLEPVTTSRADDRIKQAASVTMDVAARAEEASKAVSRKVTQDDAWDELRSDMAVLTEIVRAHHALIIDRPGRGGASTPS